MIRVWSSTLYRLWKWTETGVSMRKQINLGHRKQSVSVPLATQNLGDAGDHIHN